ncbi:MAG: MFS transporter [Christensenellaceae bacterium]|nr:MFS transporter [Christensenellaceae bacterium]
MQQKTLWTKNFKLITITTILNAIGGEAIMFPLSLVVFEETQSTLLSSILFISGFLPDILLSMLVAPFIDKGNKKRWVISMDVCFVLIYVFMGLWLSKNSFKYEVFLMFSLVTATLSVFYRLNFDSWYPDLIGVGFEQKGFAVANTIYPVTMMIMSPMAAFLYKTVGLSNLFFFNAFLMLVGIVLQSFISYTHITDKKVGNLKEYFNDIKEGLLYFKNEIGLRNIYSYVAVSNGTATGKELLVQAYFQTASNLNVVMLGFMNTAEMIGRTLGGFFQYKFEVPVKKRFSFTKMVYIVYDTLDAALLYLPFPLMLVAKFICGALGMNSANIRETAVQSYLPPTIRARVKAVMTVLFCIGMLVFQLLTGIIGEYLDYRLSIVVLSSITLIAIYFLIIRPGEVNRRIYESVRKDETKTE